ncbi:hypothetical protein FJU31_00050 [Stenotrophomonas cyclobalanopsidis]|uniref:Secreted protein n=1 Tax=Stenotrophomonas cyclobalanopsidis TaxID=2771362 RepID=A0ABQ6T571_9GAMM|nr:hypothetical protein [Stenotrophomonas cyclobalanopsidis]KAA9004286.1 hypothetical protein FJU31_00050 [Stenotrophomonas cyclobalanopsidis]
MHGILSTFQLSSAVSHAEALASATLHRHLRSFVLHRTTHLHRSIGSAVIAEKTLQMPQTKAIHQRERVHGNGYIAACAHVDPVHLMAVC